MKVEYLLSFKDHKDLQNLDNDFLNSISDNFIKSYSKKVKKKIIKPILKCNLLKNSKLQADKNTVESRVNLILNKLSKNNFEQIIEEFLIKFSEIDQNVYDIILKSIFIKMIKDEKFITIFFKFYNNINQIYGYLFELNNKEFINLIELKIKNDYMNLDLNENMKFLENFKSEEHRLNSLKLLIYLVEKKNLHIDVINIVSDFLMNTDFIPDINFWFSNKFIKNNLNIKDFNKKLIDKLNNEMNNRSLVLLKNLLDCNDIDYQIEDEDNEEEIFESSIEEVSDKTEFEIQIDNILEEYLLLEEFDEILSFFENFINEDIDKKQFMSSLINFYFNSPLNNLSKFKKLFVNLKKSKLIKSELYKNSLNEILNNDERFDYIDLDNKISKLLEIFKIIQIKVPIYKDSSQQNKK